MDVAIRPIQESDFTELIKLFTEFASFEKHPERMTNSIEQMMEEKEHILGYVALDDTDNIIGYVTVFYSYYTWVGKSLYMDDLYVKEAYRGQGIGSMLVDQAITFAKENKCKKLRWQVSDWNKSAINFYTNIGAVIDDVERNCDLIF